MAAGEELWSRADVQAEPIDEWWVLCRGWCQQPPARFSSSVGNADSGVDCSSIRFSEHSKLWLTGWREERPSRGTLGGFRAGPLQTP